MRLRHKIAVCILLAVGFGVSLYRINALDPTLAAAAAPETAFRFTFKASFEGHGDPVRVRLVLPSTTERQTVSDELFNSCGMRFHVERIGETRRGVWEKEAPEGPHKIVYSCTVTVKPRVFRIPDFVPTVKSLPQRISRYLLPSRGIQSEAREIRNLFATLVPEEKRKNAAAVVRAAYDWCRRRIRSTDARGTTDALTCLRLGEGSCGGKSRLFTALCRAGGVPARTVKGVIMKKRPWRVTHVWAECFLGGHWVPFCPLNRHFAELPSNYLSLSRGGRPIFTHTRNINFSYVFEAQEKSTSPPHVRRATVASYLNLWYVLRQVRVPVSLLKIILMIPVGALVVVLCRNVVGLETFGTFMPVLMAVAFRDTGLEWGLGLFGAILLLGGLVRWGLDKLQLLHTPRLAVLLTTVVFFVTALTLGGVVSGRVLPTRVSLFPLAVMTLTVERFALLLEEEGAARATKVVTGTLFVVACAFLLMNSHSLQVLVVTFPEVLLLVVALFIMIGRWRGIRLSEYLRFRDLILNGGQA